MHSGSDNWKDRIYIPHYSVRDAARYARTTPRTITSWQKLSGEKLGAISSRNSGDALSYIQLIELGVVSAMRKAGVPLKAIKSARNYLSTTFDAKYPFAEYEFKTSGKDLIVDSEELSEGDKNKLIVVSENGQYAWKQILEDLLQEFEYSSNGDEAVIRWNVRGLDNPVIIDPRISYGNPNVDGIQTAIIASRWNGGESSEEIAEDFGIDEKLVNQAINFEFKNTKKAA